MQKYPDGSSSYVGAARGTATWGTRGPKIHRGISRGRRQDNWTTSHKRSNQSVTRANPSMTYRAEEQAMTSVFRGGLVARICYFKVHSLARIRHGSSIENPWVISFAASRIMQFHATIYGRCQRCLFDRSLVIDPRSLKRHVPESCPPTCLFNNVPSFRYWWESNCIQPDRHNPRSNSSTGPHRYLGNSP